jgi:hypothetical protein
MNDEYLHHFNYKKRAFQQNIVEKHVLESANLSLIFVKTLRV